MRIQLFISFGLLAYLSYFATTSLAQRTTPDSRWTDETGRIYGPADYAVGADVVVIGKVVDIEKATVDAHPYPWRPKIDPKGPAVDERKTTYKIAVIKIDEPLIGGHGLTQYRVGFPSNEQSDGFRPLPVGGKALAVDQEACYFLAPHHEGNFYILASAPIIKKGGKDTKELDEVKKLAKTLQDPVTALKAKGLEERFQAAYYILKRYDRNRFGKSTAREPIPAEENKLLVELLAELPWLPKDPKPRPATDPVAPSRSTLWPLVNAHESGYRAPVYPPRKGAEPPPDYNKMQDEATAKFLKDNMEKIKIKRFVK